MATTCWCLSAQIVCRHFDNSGNRESNGLRYCSDRLEVSQTPGRVTIAKVAVGAVANPLRLHGP
jgi:hypothetical protein